MSASVQRRPATEPERVAGWRTEKLVEAGYPVALAGVLADDVTVDLHAAVDLLRAGCPPVVAVRILRS